MKALAGLTLSYLKAPLKPEKGGEDAYKIVRTIQVVDITSIPFEMEAKRTENF